MLMQTVDIGVFNNMQLIKIKQPLESIYHEKLQEHAGFSCFLHESPTHEGSKAGSSRAG